MPKSETTASPSEKKDVFRLDVAMDDPLPVRVVECVGHLTSDKDRLMHRQLGLIPQPVPQRIARNKGHGVEQHRQARPGLEHAGIMNGKDVRVTETRGDGDLAGKAIGAERT